MPSPLGSDSLSLRLGDFRKRLEYQQRNNGAVPMDLDMISPCSNNNRGRHHQQEGGRGLKKDKEEGGEDGCVLSQLRRRNSEPMKGVRGGGKSGIDKVMNNNDNNSKEGNDPCEEKSSCSPHGRDDEYQNNRGAREGKEEEEGGASPSFDIHWHSNVPYVAMLYLQLLFNLFIVFVMMYGICSVLRAIQTDVDIKVEEYSKKIMKEIGQCSKQYVENKCAGETRIPAMEEMCTNWEKCMSRDPSVVGRAKVFAETFAEIIDSFIAPISYKTMICIAAMFTGVLLLSNFAFRLARSRIVNSFSGMSASSSSSSASASSSYPHHHHQHLLQHSHSLPAPLPVGSPSNHPSSSSALVSTSPAISRREHSQ